VRVSTSLGDAGGRRGGADFQAGVAGNAALYDSAERL
jgi:hypothetical protein